MVARGTPKPSQKDTLKRIVSEIRNNNTVGHGIKYAGEGEGTLYRTGDSTMLLWDGPTALSWRQDMDYAALEIETAKSTLEKTAQDLADAGARIDETNTKLGEADARSADAAELAASVSRELDTVDTRLTTTAGELSTLKTTVGDVSEAVTASDAKIDAATSTAATAATAAEDARLAAVAAEDRVRALANAQGSLIVACGFETVTDENAAYRFATTTARTGGYVGRFRANESAPEVRWPEVRASGSQHLEMRMYATRSGVVGSAEPYGCLFYRDAGGALTSVFPNDSSIRPTVNTTWQEYVFRFDPLPTGARSVVFRSGSRSNGSTEAGYILLDDVTAYDTASYQEALDTAIAAQNDAEAAASKALDAMTRANQAYDSAAGKNSIRHATTDPQGNGTATGDVWWKWTTFPGGVVTGQWAWDGTDWVEQKASHQTIASVDLGKATVGELDGGRVKAGSIYADRIVSGVSQNMVPDPGFISAELNATRIARSLSYGDTWRFSEGQLINEPSTGGRTAASNISLAVTNDLYSWPAYPGMKLAVSCLARAVGGTGSFRWSIRVKYRDGSTTFVAIDPAYTPLTGLWETYSTSYSFPDNVASYSITFQIGANSTGIIGMRSPMAAAKTGSVLIEDGAITGEKVDAESVAAKVGQFVKVQAVNVEVTEDLATRVVNSMTANTKNLVVTGSAVIQHATLLGTTVADELNVRKLISGRDAILTGTVDIAQLNVTGTMAAEIANAMTVNTKKLVVTESAVMQHLTALEGIVTSELISQKASVEDLAAKMLTGGHIQTDPALNRGVKMDNSGIRAWDSSGTQTVNINGSNNYITGTFSTAESGQRVKISNRSSVAAIDLYASRSTSDHVGIWYDSPDTNVLNSVGRVLAISGSDHSRNSPGLEMWPMRGTFGFRGRWQQETDATKFVEISNSKGLDAGAWVQLEIPFQSPFPTNNSLLFPMVSVERVYGGDVVVMVRAITASSITIVAVNKATSGTSGAIKLRAVVFNLNA